MFRRESIYPASSIHRDCLNAILCTCRQVEQDCINHPQDHNFPRFKNRFGRSTCLDLKNSATFLPKKS